MKISVILEWENALLSELARAREMLRRLQSQIAGRPGDEFEILVMYNPEQVERGLIESVLDAELSAQARGACALVAAPGLHYYELKNEGAKRAAGELIVFLDSDIVPDPGWLDGLLSPFLSGEAVNVVTGAYYIDPAGFVGRAFAVNWFFPLRSESTRLQSAERFFANSVAFRRAFFLDRLFPAMPEGSTRGACAMLARQIRSEGHAILRNEAARVSHPAPNGLAHIVKRALAEGRDAAFKRRGQCSPLSNTRRVWTRSLKRSLVRVPQRTLRDHAKVGMPLWQTPAAIVMMMGYHLLVGLGGQLAILAPGFMSRHIRV